MVVLQLKIFKLEVKNVLYLRIDPHVGQGPGVAGQLEVSLLQVVGIQMGITEGKDKVPILQLANLGHHHSEQGIGSDIKRHSQKYIGAALVHLTAQFAIGHIKLEKSMAGRQGHVLDLSHVPGADNEAPGVGIVFDLLRHLTDLVDVPLVSGWPAPPLITVNRAQVAPFIRPFVPNRHPIVREVPDVGVPF